MQKNSKVYIFVPISIPGMKKETFYKSLERIVTGIGYKYSYIANKFFKDKCKKEMRRQRNQTEKDFQRSVDREAKYQFKECLRNLIEKSYLPPVKPHFIYIEKNHPPGAWEGTERLINEARGHLQVSVVGLIPKKIGENFSYQKNGRVIDYPFSAELFFTCLDRVQKREDHETLSGNGPESVRVLLEFLNYFRQTDLNSEFLRKFGFDKFVYAPFTHEKSSVQISSELINGLEESLDSLGSRYEERCLEKLNKIYESCKICFNDPDEKGIEDAIEFFLEQEKLLERKKELAPTLADVSKNQEQKPKKRVEEIENKISNTNEEHKFQESKVNPVEESKDEKKVNIISNEQLDKIEDDFNELTLEINYKKKKQKIPEFLGVFPISLNEIKNFSRKAIKEKANQFSEDLSLQNFFKDLECEDQSLLKFVKRPYIIALNIGKDKEILKTLVYKEFTKKLKVKLEMIGSILIPNKLMIGLCDYERSVVSIQDQYPHMVLMEGEWGSKESFHVLKALFEQENSKFYKIQFNEFKSKTSSVEKIQVNIFDKQEIVYVARTLPNVEILAETDSK